MIKNLLGFDVVYFMRSIFVPYMKYIWIISLFFTVIFSLIFWVRPISMLVRFEEWNFGILILSFIIWFLSIIVLFKLTLNLFGITFRRFMGFFILADLIILFTIIIVLWIIPGIQISGTNSSISPWEGLIWIFFIIQIFILSAYVGNRFATSTQLDIFIILRKIFRNNKALETQNLNKNEQKFQRGILWIIATIWVNIIKAQIALSIIILVLLKSIKVFFGAATGEVLILILLFLSFVFVTYFGIKSVLKSYYINPEDFFMISLGVTSVLIILQMFIMLPNFTNFAILIRSLEFFLVVIGDVIFFISTYFWLKRLT